MSDFLKNIVSFAEPFGNTTNRKTELQQSSDNYKQMLEEKITDLKTDASRIGKQALVIGGSIAAVYLLLEMILPADDDEIETKNNLSSVTPIVVERPKESSWLSKSLQTMATTALLALAKQKLSDFLAVQTEPNATENTNTAS
jgi:hypothetical protein